MRNNAQKVVCYHGRIGSSALSATGPPTDSFTAFAVVVAGLKHPGSYYVVTEDVNQGTKVSAKSVGGTGFVMMQKNGTIYIWKNFIDNQFSLDAQRFFSLINGPKVESYVSAFYDILKPTP